MIKRALKVGTLKVTSPQCSIRLRVKVVTDNNPAVMQFLLVLHTSVFFLQNWYFWLGMDGLLILGSRGGFENCDSWSVFVSGQRVVRQDTGLQ